MVKRERIYKREIGHAPSPILKDLCRHRLTHWVSFLPNGAEAAEVELLGHPAEEEVWFEASDGTIIHMTGWEYC